MKKITHKWFGTDFPTNAEYASVQIGAGVDGVITVTADTLGTEENAYSLEVVEGSGLNVAMSATITDGAIVVVLGTDALGALDNTKNTAVLIAAAIDALSGVSAESSGTGATAFEALIAKKAFTGGSYATVTHEPAYMIDANTNAIYMAEESVGRFDTDKWKTGTIAVL